MIRYYVNGLADAPEAVECELAGYPHQDAKDRTQYDNSHYDTEAEAWDELRGGVDAVLRQSARHVDERRKELAQAEKQLVEAALHQQRVLAGFERWAGDDG